MRVGARPAALAGSASVADYQTAIRSIVFANGSDTPSTATRTIEWVVNDGDATSTAVTRDIVINTVNDMPTVQTGFDDFTGDFSGSSSIIVNGKATVESD